MHSLVLCIDKRQYEDYAPNKACSEPQPKLVGNKKAIVYDAQGNGADGVQRCKQRWGDRKEE